MMRKNLILLVCLMLMLMGCSVPLTADITPPPDSDLAKEIEETMFPLFPPDPLEGKPIYDEKCATCHGDAGLGDGPQARDLPGGMPAIGEPEVSNTASPENWFKIISWGKQNSLMPEFSENLEDGQRWDVLVYVYTLSTSPKELEEGKAIYIGQCQSCHGVLGRGDGRRTANLVGQMPDWGDPSRLANRSNRGLWEAITNGIGTEMPGFSVTLDEAQRWAAAGYVRALSFAKQLEEKDGNADAELTSKADGFAISGRVINDSDGEVPAGMLVTLEGYEGSQLMLSDIAKVQSGGSYQFDEVELMVGRIYVTSVEHNQMIFRSEMIYADDIHPGEEAYLVINIFETSADVGSLVAERVHIYFDFSDEGTLRVAELFVISNSTNRLVVAASQGKPVLEFDLPEDAINLKFEKGELGERFILTADGFGDTQSIPAGLQEHQIMYYYELPYESGRTLILKMPLAVQEIFVAVADTGVDLQSDQVKDVPPWQRIIERMDVQLYTASGLPMGSELVLNLSGQPQFDSHGEDAKAKLMLGFGAFGAVIIVFGVFLYRKWRKTRSEYDEEVSMDRESESVERLLGAIVDLDDQYRLRKVADAVYQVQRAELKKRLGEVISSEK